VESSCEHGNEHSVGIKCVEYLTSSAANTFSRTLLYGVSFEVVTFREEVFRIEHKQQMLHYFDYKIRGLCSTHERQDACLHG
jgi:hypothetical protein